MQMSIKSLCRSMIRNIKNFFPSKTEMHKKQVLQDPVRVSAADACMPATLQGLTSHINVDAVNTYKQKYAQYTLKMFICHVDVDNAIKLQCRS